MAEEPRPCPHPRAKVIAEWVEPDSVHHDSCFQWFHCEACGKHWREARRAPVPRGSRLSDVDEGEDVTATPVRRDDGRLHLSPPLIVGVIVLQAAVLAAMIWFLVAGPLHF